MRCLHTPSLLASPPLGSQLSSIHPPVLCIPSRLHRTLEVAVTVVVQSYSVPRRAEAEWQQYLQRKTITCRRFELAGVSGIATSPQQVVESVADEDQADGYGSRSGIGRRRR